MLLIREEHAVRGEAEDEFDATVRDEWLPALGKTDEARLLYYTRLASRAAFSSTKRAIPETDYNRL